MILNINFIIKLIFIVFMQQINIQDLIKIGNFIDVQDIDKDKTWRVAEIMKINEKNKTVYVHFDG